MSGPFRRRTLAALVAGAAVSFAAFLALSVFEEELTVVRSGGNDAFSLSALGHAAWVAVMDELDVAVHVRRELRAHPHPEALVVVAEPATDDDARQRLRQVLERAERALVVLPKWHGVRSPVSHRKIELVTPVDDDAVDAVLDAAGVDGELVRSDEREPPGGWTSRDLVGRPSTPFMQLLKSGLDPVLSCDAGILVGRVPGAPDTWVVTDPDLIANHGLRRGDNASLMMQIVDRARRGGGVVVDETIHGHGVERSMWRDLFEFPLVLVLVQALIALGVALWAGVVRFGSPVPVGPAFAAGRLTLVDNTAALLLHGGRSSALLGRYLERAVEDVATAHGSPPGATRAERMDVARRVAERRGAREDVDALAGEVRSCVRSAADPGRSRGGEQHALRLARRVHEWRGDCLDGHRQSGRDGGRDP